MDFLVNIVTALLVGQLQYMSAHTPAPSSARHECGAGQARPVHIMPADKWVCPPADEPVDQPSPR